MKRKLLWKKTHNSSIKKTQTHTYGTVFFIFLDIFYAKMKNYACQSDGEWGNAESKSECDARRCEWKSGELCRCVIVA